MRPGSDAVTKQALISPGRLLRQSLRQFGRHWFVLSVIVLVVALPLNLIQVQAPAGSPLPAYGALAAAIMNLALIWASLEILAGRPVSFRRAYLEGTARLVAFGLVSFLIALMLLPAFMGLVVYLLGAGQGGVTVAVGEQVLVGAVATLIALPSFWLVVRLGWAAYAAVTGDGPLVALGRSWRLTRGRFWALTIRGLALVGFLLLTLLVPLTLLNLVTNGNVWVAAGLQTLATVPFLTLTNLTLGRLYLELSHG